MVLEKTRQAVAIVIMACVQKCNSEFLVPEDYEKRLGELLRERGIQDDPREIMHLLLGTRLPDGS